MLRRSKLAPIVLLWCGASILTPEACWARLGEKLESFRTRTGKLYNFKNDSRKDNNHYYMFSMVLEPQQQEAAPGVAAGVTLTTVNGRIVGESMAIRFGDGSPAAKLFGTAKCLEFVYDAVGKPKPKKPEEAEAEFNAFTQAADQALLGSPQNIRYRGYNSKITLSRTTFGDLVIAVTPDKPLLPAKIEPIKQTEKRSKEH
jgi:hypothetical protein